MRLELTFTLVMFNNASHLLENLDPEVSEVCRTAPSSIMLSLIAVIAGIVMIVSGGVLSGVGALRKSPSQIAPTTQSGQVDSSAFGRRRAADFLH